MNLDKVFCAGARCSKTNSCALYMGHVHNHLEQMGEDMRLVHLNVAQFADYAGACNKYAPLVAQVLDFPEAPLISREEPPTEPAA